MPRVYTTGRPERGKGLPCCCSSPHPLVWQRAIWRVERPGSESCDFFFLWSKWQSQFRFWSTYWNPLSLSVSLSVSVCLSVFLVGMCVCVWRGRGGKTNKYSKISESKLNDFTHPTHPYPIQTHPFHPIQRHPNRPTLRSHLIHPNHPPTSPDTPPNTIPTCPLSSSSHPPSQSPPPPPHTHHQPNTMKSNDKCRYNSTTSVPLMVASSRSIRIK